MGSETTITLKNVHILDLKRWLDVPLPPGKMNRNRNEFLNLLKNKAEEIETQRIEIVKMYAKKDKDGNQNLITPEFATGDDKKAEDDYQEMMKEPLTLIIEKPMALEIARAVLKSTTAKFGFEEGSRFEEVCTAMSVEFPDEPVKKSPIIVQ